LEIAATLIRRLDNVAERVEGTGRLTVIRAGAAGRSVNLRFFQPFRSLAVRIEIRKMRPKTVLRELAGYVGFLTGEAFAVALPFGTREVRVEPNLMRNSEPIFILRCH